MKSALILIALIILVGCNVQKSKIEPSVICYKNLQLGDKITKVKSVIKNLKRNYEGEDNEFFSISEPSIEMKSGVLTPSVLFKFNSNDELYYFSITYTYDGVLNGGIDKEIFKAVFNSDILCLKGETLNGRTDCKDAVHLTSFESIGFPSFTFIVYSKSF
jgi:hypothetical protein